MQDKYNTFKVKNFIDPLFEKIFKEEITVDEGLDIIICTLLTYTNWMKSFPKIKNLPLILEFEKDIHNFMEKIGCVFEKVNQSEKT
jgi:hypothetical protein